MNAPALEPTALPLLLMAIVAPLGAVDILYFHVWKFRLYRQPSARTETVTHLLRGLFFAAGAYLLSSYELAGGWFWAVGALLAIDFFNSVADVALEPESRAPLGGLPRLESVIHLVGATFAGGITVAYFLSGWSKGSLPTALEPIGGALPAWLAWQGHLLAAGSLALTSVELGLFVGSFFRSPRPVAAT